MSNYLNSYRLYYLYHLVSEKLILAADYDYYLVSMELTLIQEDDVDTSLSCLTTTSTTLTDFELSG